MTSSSPAPGKYPEEKPLPLAMRCQDGAEPWPGYHEDLEMQFALVDSIVGEHGRSIADVGELADLVKDLPRDMSVYLEPVVYGMGGGPYAVSTLIARRIMLTERHDEPAGPYTDGWEGFVPGLELRLVYLPAGVPADHVPTKDELAPVSLRDKAEAALQDGRFADWFRAVSGQLNLAAENIDNEMIDYLSRTDPVRERLRQEAQRLLQQAQRLLDLADPVQAAADSDS